MYNRSINCLTNDNVINVINPKIDIILSLVPKVESLIRQVGNVSSQLAAKHYNSPNDSRFLKMTEHTQQLRCTAEAVIITANTVIELQSTVVDGEDRQHPLSPRNLSQELKKPDVTEWISHLTVDHEDLELESESMSELMPDDSISSISSKRHKRGQQTNEAGTSGSFSIIGENAGHFTNMETGSENPFKDTSEMVMPTYLNQSTPNGIEEDFDSDTTSERTQTAHGADLDVDTTYDKESAKRLVTALVRSYKANEWTYNDALLELSQMEIWQGLGSSSSAVGTLRYLLEEGGDVNAMSTMGSTALHRVSARGNTALLDLLIERNAEIDVKNSRGYTALHNAAHAGHTIVVEILLNNHADIERKTEETQNTALLLAARKGRASTVEHLLKAGANIHARNKVNDTALSLAARYDHNQVFSILLNAGSSVDAADKSGWTPLHRASQDSHVEVVEVLLKAGASFDAGDKDDRTPLHWAAIDNHVERAEVLLRAGASVDARDKDGYTPLHYAAIVNHVEIAEVLLKAGASLDALAEGWTPLHFASDKGHVEVVEFLLKAGASVHARDNFGSAPLHRASTCGHVKVVEVLSKAGASLDARDKLGWTSLHFASEMCRVEVAEVLLKAGASIIARTNYGSTAFFRAAYYGHRETIELLLARGADIRARSNGRDTVLHETLRYKHDTDCDKQRCSFCAGSATRKDIVKLLCKKGANPSAKDEYGMSVLSLVRKSDAYAESEKKALMKVLKRFGAK